MPRDADASAAVAPVAPWRLPPRNSDGWNAVVPETHPEICGFKFRRCAKRGWVSSMHGQASAAWLGGADQGRPGRERERPSSATCCPRTLRHVCRIPMRARRSSRPSGDDRWARRRHNRQQWRPRHLTLIPRAPWRRVCSPGSSARIKR